MKLTLILLTLFVTLYALGNLAPSRIVRGLSQHVASSLVIVLVVILCYGVIAAAWPHLP